MSLIYCPECAAKLSDKAFVCPYCGYEPEGRILISRDKPFEAIPMIMYMNKNGEIEDNRFFSVYDNRTIYHTLFEWRVIEGRFPLVASLLWSMSHREKRIGMDMNSFIKETISNGSLLIKENSDNKLFIYVHDENGFKEESIESLIKSGTIKDAIDHLRLYENMQDILKDINALNEEMKIIASISPTKELALAKASRDKLLLAIKMTDSRMRRMSTIDAITSATEAKNLLILEFNASFNLVDSSMDFKNVSKDLFKLLRGIILTIEIECQGFATLGEYLSSKEALLQFKAFIENKNNERNKSHELLEEINISNNNLIDKFKNIIPAIECLGKY